MNEAKAVLRTFQKKIQLIETDEKTAIEKQAEVETDLRECANIRNLLKRETPKFNQESLADIKRLAGQLKERCLGVTGAVRDLSTIKTRLREKDQEKTILKEKVTAVEAQVQELSISYQKLNSDFEDHRRNVQKKQNDIQLLTRCANF